MANLHQLDRKELLSLDDLHVGQRFISGTHLIDEEQIKAFAGNVPNLLIWEGKAVIVS